MLSLIMKLNISYRRVLNFQFLLISRKKRELNSEARGVKYCFRWRVVSVNTILMSTLMSIKSLKIALRTITNNMQAIQRWIFLQDRFYDLWSSERPAVKINKEKIAPNVGPEPTTVGLRVQRSTDLASRARWYWES